MSTRNPFRKSLQTVMDPQRPIEQGQSIFNSRCEVMRAGSGVKTSVMSV